MSVIVTDILFLIVVWQVDHWLEYSVRSMSASSDSKSVMSHLDTVLAPRVFLVGYSLSLADIAIFAALRSQSLEKHIYIYIL